MKLIGNIVVLSNTFARTKVACDFLINAGYNINILPALEGQQKKDWIRSNLQKADAVIVGHDRIDKELIENSQSLRVIAKQGVGLDNIDTLVAKDRNIKVITATGGNSDSVADLAFLLILAVSRQLILANDVVRNGKWDRIVGFELRNKNLGIIGFGEIGQRVAARAKGFSMSIAYYDIIEHCEAEHLYSAKKMDLLDLMAWADYVSIHIPLNANTKKIINANLFSLMKPTSFLINTSRGGVVDEKALYEFLINNRIAGAGLDVFELEPPNDLSLARLPNVIATPHMAAYTFEAIEQVSMQVANSVLESLRNHDIS
jgi:D-3-phosphoglycerate dehydrogenase